MIYSLINDAIEIVFYLMIRIADVRLNIFVAGSPIFENSRGFHLVIFGKESLFLLYEEFIVELYSKFVRDGG